MQFEEAGNWDVCSYGLKISLNLRFLKPVFNLAAYHQLFVGTERIELQKLSSSHLSSERTSWHSRRPSSTSWTGEPGPSFPHSVFLNHSLEFCIEQRS